MFIVIGNSEDIDGHSVADEILEICQDKLSGRNPKAGILFASIDTEAEILLDRIFEVWPDIELVGTSTDGELSPDGFAEDSVTLMLLGGDGVEFTAGLGRNLSQDVEAACAAAVNEAMGKTNKPPCLCIATPESLTANARQVVDILNENLGPDIPLFGATSGDQWRFEGTRQFYGKEILSDSVPVLLFSGDISYGFGMGTGFTVVGEPGIVTRSEGAVCHEIDGQPTLEFYRKYLGPGSMPTGERPLAVLNDAGEMEYLRASQEGFVDQETGVVTFFADVPQGSKVQIAVADRDAIVNGCAIALDAALGQYPEGKTPDAAMIFSCSARRLLLGTRVGDEYQHLRSKLGEDVEIGGFYGYGEICPNTGHTNARFHNETFITLLIGT